MTVNVSNHTVNNNNLKLNKMKEAIAIILLIAVKLGAVILSLYITFKILSMIFG